MTAEREVVTMEPDEEKECWIVEEMMQELWLVLLTQIIIPINLHK